jgi:hypothetical protein
MGLLFEPGDESAGPLKCHVEIVDAEEQEQPVARFPKVWWEQDGETSGVRIFNLTL